MNSYYLWMAGSALVCTGLGVFLARKTKKPVSLALLTLLLGSLCGILGAKLLYYIARIDFMIADGWLKSLIDTRPTEWCFFGGMMGVILGTCLAAKCLRIRPTTALDALAPAGALMAALSRISGSFLTDYMAGCGMILDTWEYPELEKWCFYPVTVANQYDEHYLAIFMLEGLCALIVAAVSLCCFKRDRFLRTLFYLCLPQALCESFHSNSISWLFVRVEQVLSMVTVLAILIVYMVRLVRKVRAAGGKATFACFWPAVSWAICGGIIIGAMFAVDKTDWPKWMIYLVMLLGLVQVGVAECIAHRRLVRTADGNASAAMDANAL